jgi:GntR family transcriptional regulator
MTISDIGPTLSADMEDVVNTDPVYIQLQKKLLSAIQRREFDQGSRFPSERELSDRFGTSRVTMRKAIDRLVQMGVLERRPRSGTYLPERLFDRPISEHASYSISDVVEKAGHVPGSKLLYFERKLADKTCSTKLEIAVDTPIISIQRLRSVDGIPVCVEFIEIPAHLIPGLSASDVLENKSLYAHFRDVYHLSFRNKTSTISVHWATAAEAECLNLPEGSPVLKFESVNVLNDGTPFEFLRSLNHPDHVSFSLNHGKQSEIAPASASISMMMSSIS